MNETLVGVLWGIALGPRAAGIFDPRSWREESNVITLEVMRIVLGASAGSVLLDVALTLFTATGLFAIGVDLPKNYVWKHRKGLSILVVPTMAIGWVTVAGTQGL